MGLSRVCFVVAVHFTIKISIENWRNDSAFSPEELNGKIPPPPLHRFMEAIN